MRIQKHGFFRAKRILILLGISAAVIGLAIIFFPISGLRHTIHSQTEAWLAGKFGAGSRIGEIDLNWRSLTIRDIVIPIHNSRIDVERIEIDLDPIQFIAHPSNLTRAIRAVWLNGAIIHVAIQKSPTDSLFLERSWIPSRKIPPSFYNEIGRLDSLKEIAFENCRLYIDRSDSASVEVSEFRGIIEQAQPGRFRIRTNGIVLADSVFNISIGGDINCLNRTLSIQASTDIPRGSLPYLSSTNFRASTEGIRLTVQASATDSAIEFGGSAIVNGLTIHSPAGILEFDTLRIALTGDTLAVAACTFNRPPMHGDVSGFLLMRDSGLLNFRGSAEISELSALCDTMKYLPEISGKFQSDFTLSGDLSDPLLNATAGFSNLSVLRQPFNNASIQFSLTPSRFEIQELEFSTGTISSGFMGGIDLTGHYRADIRGDIIILSPPGFLGRRSDLRSIAIELAGPLSNPYVDMALYGEENCLLGSFSVSRTDSEWTAVSQSNAGYESRIELTADDGSVRISAHDIHNLAEILFPHSAADLHSIRSSRLLFKGDNRRGDLEFDVEIIPDSTRLYTQIAREAHFGGQYRNAGSERMILSGKWSGVSSEEQPFTGRGELILDESLMTINRFFIDEVGELSGWVNPQERMLNLQLQINELTAERFPIKPVFIRRAGIEGDLSGFFEIRGSFENPEWIANLAMTNGAVFGVPGYWINVESEGRGRIIQLRSVEVGRDVRKIITLSGTINFPDNQLTLDAEVGAARAEDFLLALTGRTGFFSGELDGHAVMSGLLNHPDIQADLTIRNGYMLNEIYVNEFHASFQTDTTSDGKRIYRIPQCRFFKEGTYRFAGYAQTGIGGEDLSAHLEGSGDFLDLIDQVDRTFVTEGSTGNIQLDLGGTLQNPILIGGSLNLQNGRFTYADATPDDVTAEIALSIASGGNVEPGYIRFSSGNQWVEIRIVSAEQSARAGLDPLIIPIPRLKLGILEIRTGEEGMPLRVSGLMKPEWYGPIAFGSSDGEPVTISAWSDDRLLISGAMTVRNTRLTYPFVGGETNPNLIVAHWLVKRLEEAQWELSIAVGFGNHYDVEITGLKNSDMFAPLKESAIFGTLADYVDHLSIDAIIDPGDTPIRVRGTIEDSTFFLIGRITSSRGTVEYLDQTFTIDNCTADFDETNVVPILEGRAETEGADSLGRTVPIYLTMYQIDRETNIRYKRGRFDQVTFILESESGSTPEQVLLMLGYDPQEAGSKAGQLVATTFARVIGRQWLDPLERQLERWTPFDEVAFNPGGGRASPLVRQQRERAETDSLNPNSTIRFFTGSQVTVGKYLTPDLFVTYTGELTEGQIDVGTRIGLVHLWNLEYRIEPLSRDLVLDFAVEYDEVERKRDESVSLKYSFVLEP